MLMLFQNLYSARDSDAASWDRDCSLPRMRRSKWLRSRRRRSLQESGQDWGHDSERSGPEWRLTTRPEARDQAGWGQGGGGQVEDGGRADSGDCGGGGLCRWHDAIAAEYAICRVYPSGVRVWWLLLRLQLLWRLLLRWLPLGLRDWQRDWVRIGDRVKVHLRVRLWLWSRCGDLWYIRS